ncbi:MAG: CaiB/BaiF CoA transferase family protein [Anaerolineae bacterium]
MAERTLEDIQQETEGLLWPLSPILSFEEVYAGAPEAEVEWSRFLEDRLHWRDEDSKYDALSRLRVLDCGINNMATHWFSSMFAEMGADTIMVEPIGGDPSRRYVPFGRRRYYFFDSETGEPCGPQFLQECRNKLSVTLNLETEEGREILRRLALQADVLVENYPPGQFDEWGIGYRQLSKINPRLVYVWLGQRGQWGPAKDRPGELEPTGQCASGFTHGTGAPEAFGGRPTRSGLWFLDHVCATGAVHSALAALIYRDQTSGKGQFIENTAANGNIRIIDYNWLWYGFDGSIRPRYGNWDLAINIYAVNPVSDGFLMVGGGHDRLWYRIWKTVAKDRPDLEQLIVEDPGLRLVTDRLGHYMQVKTYTVLSEWGKDKSRQEAEDALLEEEVASGGVLFIDEVAEYSHFKYRGHLMANETQHYGKVLFGTPPNQMYKTPARVKMLGRPAGYDNEDVYKRLVGLTAEELRNLKAANVI